VDAERLEEDLPAKVRWAREHDAEVMQKRHEGELKRCMARCQRENSDELLAQQRDHLGRK